MVLGIAAVYLADVAVSDFGGLGRVEPLPRAAHINKAWDDAEIVPNQVLQERGPASAPVVAVADMHGRQTVQRSSC